MSGPRDEVVNGMAELIRAGEPFVLATVVRTVAAAAAKPGAKALIRVDGPIVGWIGGGCARSAVERAARQTLRDGRARLIRIQPRGEGEPAAKDLEVHLSSCPNGGTHLIDAPQTVIIGTMILPVDNGIVYLPSDICKPAEDKRTRFIGWEAVELVEMISTRDCGPPLDPGGPPLA